jgi:bacillithiol system protein YtxJ
MPDRIRTQAELDAALASERFLLFKHSTRCPISAAAFGEYQSWSRAHPAEATGWVDVVADRELSLSVARRTGVKHESPQAIVVRGGKAVWDESHGAITKATLEEGMG